MYLTTIIIDFILKYLKQNKKKVRKMDEMIVKKKVLKFNGILSELKLCCKKENVPS